MKISISFGKTSINDIIKKYKNIGKNIDELKEVIIQDMKDVGLREINSSIGSSEYKTAEPLMVVEEKTAIGIRGSQAIYDEYGTGTIGANNPHPEKLSSLNDYNSGSTIRPNKRGYNIDANDGSGKTIPQGGLYWTYRLNGEKIYTQGRPAGMHVYKAKRKIRNDLNDIVKKRVGEYLSKL